MILPRIYNVTHSMENAHAIHVARNFLRTQTLALVLLRCMARAPLSTLMETSLLVTGLTWAPYGWLSCTNGSTDAVPGQERR